ncbi:MAG: DUF1178 family protein [Betaproteobacteria bacterium]|nr:DUF1178 family protein [Betaproteobacteria bacterium]
MIVFELGCGNNHRFEGWFTSNDDFERQASKKLISCPLCGNSKIGRLPHAAHVRTGARERNPHAEAAGGAPRQYTNMGGEVLAKLIEHIIENTEDVGALFPEEARRIHYHETPDRRIRGTASQDEIEALKDEGIEIIALPIPAHRVGKSH